MAILTRFFLRCQEERGASLVEYALLLALIALVCIAAVTQLGGSVNSKFQSVSGMF
jgi:pilus assembly protein Flp/PilA